METARARFVIEAEISDLSHAELCRRHGISRPTGHKWIRRYETEKLKGLEDRSHRSRSCPHATSDLVVQRILELRKQRTKQRDVWGARKIQRLLQDDPTIEAVPSRDTIHRILVRHGCIDALSIWWISLGIVPELIEPGKPQQNGRHERLHLTLKRRTVSPPAPLLPAQQRAFNRFRRVYTCERPHEALKESKRPRKRVNSTSTWQLRLHNRRAHDFKPQRLPFRP